MHQMLPACKYNTCKLSNYKYYLVVKKINKSKREAMCLKLSNMQPNISSLQGSIGHKFHPCHFIEAQTEHGGEVICHISGQCRLGAQVTDPQATGLCIALPLDHPQLLSLSLCPPIAWQSWRRRWATSGRASEQSRWWVHLCLPGCEVMLSAALGQVMGPQAADASLAQSFWLGW